MKHVTTLLHARWVIPVEPADQVLEHHSVAIEDGRIVALLPSREARSHFSAEHVVELDKHALIPGFINAHTHAAMTLMRGYADDMPLQIWLEEHIWPTEAAWVDPEFIRDGTRLAIAEMVRGGTTCFNDMYFFPDEVAREVEHAGIRAGLGLVVLDFPSAWAQNADEYLHKGLAVHDQLRHNPLLHTMLAPHAPYSVSDQALSKVVMYAEELDLPVHMHVHETASEVSQARLQTGRTPLERLTELGLVGPRLLAVHMTQLTDEEIAQFAASGAHVVHCPESNLKLASGFCPVAKLLKHGVNVALGTDGAASNNDLDMLGEMRTAALLAKGVAHDASAVPAMTALRMATINGARALGIDHITGSIEPGKAADLTAIRLEQLETQPLYNPLSKLVYAATREQVTDVWVAGQHLLKERRLTTLDEEDILMRAKRWQQKLRRTDQPREESP
ncbi:MAG TPA: TRZ/ATZ family hydrolase [Gammaproteobacteria bacterium]